MSVETNVSVGSEELTLNMATPAEVTEEKEPPQMYFRWGRTIAMVLVHVAALSIFIPWVFSWTAIIVALVSWKVFGMMGITIGYHRLLTHQGFTCPKWVERSLATLGACCLQGPPARWVGTHRAHHQFSDEEDDPHSPRKSFFWSHMGWLFFDTEGYLPKQVCERYAPDLMRSRFYSWLERGLNTELLYVIHAALYWLAGFGFGWWAFGSALAGVQLGTSLVVWAVVFRTVWVWHVTWSVNSVTHVFGYRNYDEPDDSRNNWLVALMAHGEGWHNNHHADQRSACHGHRWWEFDLSYQVIRTMKLFRLARDVVTPEPKRIQNKYADKQPPSADS